MILVPSVAFGNVIDKLNETGKFLKLNETVVVHSFDNGAFQSVAAGKKYIDQLYPKRHILIKGDSKETLPKFIEKIIILKKLSKILIF